MAERNANLPDAGFGAAAPPLRLLYVVSEDWYFLSHRLPMARAARDAGFEVHVATNVADGAAAIEAEGFILHPIPFARGRLSPHASLATIVALRRIHRLIAPATTHHVSLQPSLLGLVAVLGRPTACVNALSGLGFAFTRRRRQRTSRGAHGMALIALGVAPSPIIAQLSTVGRHPAVTAKDGVVLSPTRRALPLWQIECESVTLRREA